MRVIPTSAHAVVDYTTAFTLLVAPKLWRLEEVPASAAAFYVAGGGLTATSLVTDYELSAANVLPMRAHLALDIASGAALAASPFLFGFRQSGPRYWLAHVAIGATEIVTAALTKPERISKRSTVASALKEVGSGLANLARALS